MRLSGDLPFSTAPTRSESYRTLDAVLASGIRFIDTADTYGLGHNESLLGDYIKSNPTAGLAISTKVGQCHDGSERWSPLGDPRYLRQQIYGSLRRLGVGQLHCLFLHRVDPRVEMNIQMDVLVEFLTAGFTQAIGVSGVNAKLLREIAESYPISFVQNRHNLAVGPDHEVLAVCREFNITLVAYAPLHVGDHHTALSVAAANRGLTLQQLALRWAVSFGNVLPIPGSKCAAHVAEWSQPNWEPLDDDLNMAINSIVKRGIDAGS